MRHHNSSQHTSSKFIPQTDMDRISPFSWFKKKASQTYPPVTSNIAKRQHFHHRSNHETTRKLSSHERVRPRRPLDIERDIFSRASPRASFYGTKVHLEVVLMSDDLRSAVDPVVMQLCGELVQSIQNGSPSIRDKAVDSMVECIVAFPYLRYTFMHMEATIPIKKFLQEGLQIPALYQADLALEPVNSGVSVTESSSVNELAYSLHYLGEHIVSADGKGLSKNFKRLLGYCGSDHVALAMLALRYTAYILRSRGGKESSLPKRIRVVDDPDSWKAASDLHNHLANHLRRLYLEHPLAEGVDILVETLLLVTREHARQLVTTVVDALLANENYEIRQLCPRATQQARKIRALLPSKIRRKTDIEYGRRQILYDPRTPGAKVPINRIRPMDTHSVDSMSTTLSVINRKDDEDYVAETRPPAPVVRFRSHHPSNDHSSPKHRQEFTTRSLDPPSFHDASLYDHQADLYHPPLSKSASEPGRTPTNRVSPRRTRSVDSIVTIIRVANQQDSDDFVTQQYPPEEPSSYFPQDVLTCPLHRSADPQRFDDDPFYAPFHLISPPSYDCPTYFDDVPFVSEPGSYSNYSSFPQPAMCSVAGASYIGSYPDLRRMTY